MSLQAEMRNRKNGLLNPSNALLILWGLSRTCLLISSITSDSFNHGFKILLIVDRSAKYVYIDISSSQKGI